MSETSTRTHYKHTDDTNERKAPEEVVAENRETIERVADGDDAAAEYAQRLLSEVG